MNQKPKAPYYEFDSFEVGPPGAEYFLFREYRFVDEDDQNEEGELIETKVPASNEVCGTCRGNGKHVNPAIDSHGISPEEFDEDPDFKEAYFSGAYDVTCEECLGNRVVLTPNIEKIRDKATRERLDEFLNRQARDEAEDRHTRRMENGGRD